MKKIILAILIAGIAATPAFAGQYIAGEIGAYFPEEGDFDTGLNLELSYGMDLKDLVPDLPPQSWLNQVAAEVGIGYYSSEFDETIFGTEVEGDLSVVPLTLTAICKHQLEGMPLQLFGGVGVGLYFASVEVEITDPFFGKVEEDDSSTEFGLNFEGGVLYPMSDVVNLYAELEWDLVSDDVGGLFLDAGLQYRF